MSLNRYSSLHPAPFVEVVEEIKEEVLKNYIQKEKLIEMNKYISSLKDKYKISIQNYEN